MTIISGIEQWTTICKLFTFSIKFFLANGSFVLIALNSSSCEGLVAKNREKRRTRKMCSSLFINIYDKTIYTAILRIVAALSNPPLPTYLRVVWAVRLWELCIAFSGPPSQTTDIAGSLNIKTSHKTPLWSGTLEQSWWEWGLSSLGWQKWGENTAKGNCQSRKLRLLLEKTRQARHC